MIKRILPIFLFLISGTFFCTADPVVDALKKEMDRNFKVLQNESIPAYYISVRLDEYQTISTLGRMGRLQTPVVLNSPERVLSSSMRVGNYELDNSHEIRESGWGSYRDLRTLAQYVPYEDNEYLLRTALWLQLDDLYKEDIQTYEQIKANMAVKVEQEDKSPDFTREKVEVYYEDPISWESLNINCKELENKVRLYSSVFDENDDLLDGYAYFEVYLGRRIIVDTDGREIAENTVTFNLGLTADAWAEDGMYLPLTKTWVAFAKEELPSDEEVLAAAREMSETLSALKTAPVVESFTGPAVLSPEASGVFFHEIFGHRVEGTRLKQETDAQTFKKKIGETVLPKHISVTFDPTRKYYNNTPLNGYYVFDDEGIRGQKVEVVKKGVLRDFLMSRTPIEGFLHSNGHGRAQLGAAPISRQSNLIIESTQKLSHDELMKRLRKEAKNQGKEYAYYFKAVSGGFTNTNRYSPNSFNVTPLIVYRVYVDGRPSELVRGVDMVGTPLAMFSQIEACGDDYAVFNGICGAESGSVPVSCVSPALLVKHIETQKRAKNQSQPPLLKKPTPELSTTLAGSDLIASAMKTEVDRALSGLKMDNLQSPFFIAYTLGDMKNLKVSASHGTLMGSDFTPFRSTSARLLIGDYLCSDENYIGTTGGSRGYDGSPCMDNDEKGIRYTIWRDLDAIYKSAAETYEQKLATIKQLNIPAKNLELPDWDKTPVVVMNDLPQNIIDFDKARYESYVKEASAIFNQYDEILDSNVSVNLLEAMIYFYNTEGTEFRYPLSVVALSGRASAKNDEGEDLQSSFFQTYATSDELPALDQLKKECHTIAEQLIEEIHAPKLDVSYSGPVLFEKLAAVSAVYGNLVQGNNISLIASRKPLTSSGFSSGGNSIEDMMDKRVMAKEITIEDFTGTKEYMGQKLFGYAPIDGQGVVPPQKLTLVKNGILKTLLSDRIPTPKVPHSNGHALLGVSMGSSITPGVIKMTDSRTKTNEELRAELLARAQEEGYEYAYIVRETNGNGSFPILLYRVDVKTGKETRIRSAAIKNLDDKSFRNILGVSDKEFIYNTMASSPVTVIVPEAILFEELQIQSDRVDNFRKPPVVGQ